MVVLLDRRSGLAERVQHEPDDDGAEHGHDERRDESLDVTEAHLTCEPAADEPTEDADHDIRQAAPGGSPLDEGTGDQAGEEADDDPAEPAHLEHGASLASARRPCAAVQLPQERPDSLDDG